MIYCYHCMSKIENDSAAFCPECGKKCSEYYPKSDELPPGTTLSNGRYLVGASIGSGGFGITYIGRDMTLNKRIVIKETFYNGLFSRNTYDKSQSNPLSVSYSGISFERITQKAKKECETLASAEGLDNIVKVYDYFFENNTSYIITEFIEGETLYTHVKNSGIYTWDDLYSKMKPLIYSLAELHSMNILHRDIKPENIMIKENKNLGDKFVLIDFGLARSSSVNATMSMGMSFTPGYSPFEQRTLQGKEGEYIDVYALAATMYFALTGNVPDAAVSDSMELNFPKMAELTPVYGVPAHVVTALKNALKQNYTQRTQNLKAFLSEIENKSVTIEKKEVKTFDNAQSSLTSEKTIAASMTSNHIFTPNITPPPSMSYNGVNTNNNGYPQNPMNTMQNGGMTYGGFPQGSPPDMVTVGGKGVSKAAVIVSSLLTIALILSFIGIAMLMNKEPEHVKDTDSTKSSISSYIDDTISSDYTTDSSGSIFNITDPDALVDIDAGNYHTIGLKNDGTVVACGSNDYGQCDVSDWTDIIDVGAGADHSVGLKRDGTVVAVGSNYYGQSEVSDWTDIAAISVGAFQTVGLKNDGTVVACGNNEDGQCNVSDWEDIVAISSGYRHTVGLLSNGYVVTCGWNKYNQCDTTNWSDITAVSAGNVHTLGLKSDGTVVAVGKNDEQECDVSEWADIKSISAGYAFSFGLKYDGTILVAGIDDENDFGELSVQDWTDIGVVAAGNGHSVGIHNDGTAIAAGLNEYGECDVTNWETITYSDTDTDTDTDTDIDKPDTSSDDSAITQIAAGHSHSVGLKEDGTVIASGYNVQGQCNVSDWTDITAIAAGTWHTVGLKSDSTVIAAGDNEHNECDVSGWKDIVKVSAGTYHTVGLTKNGTILKSGTKYGNLDTITEWTNIADIASGGFHTVGLKKDGTVVAAGANEHGECDVSTWKDIVQVAAGDGYTIGVKKDGTVVACGDNDYGQCNVSSWNNIVQVAAGVNHTVGLKKDGTCVAVGWKNWGKIEVSEWKDIEAVSAGNSFSLALTKYGEVIAVGDSISGVCDTEDWYIY